MKDNITELFAECLDRLERGETTIDRCLEEFPEMRAELEPLLRMALDIRDVSQIQPSRSFVQYSPTRLINRIRDSQKPRSIRDVVRSLLQGGPPMTPWLRPVVTILVIAIVGFTMMSAITVQAASSALPGDLLYPVKLGIEDARLLLANEKQDILLQIEFAQQREKEIHQLQEAGRFDEMIQVEGEFSDLVDTAADGVIEREDANPAWNKRALDQLGATLDQHLSVLNSVIRKAPFEKKPAIRKAIQTSEEQRKKIEESRPAVGAPPATSTPTTNPTPTEKPTLIPTYTPTRPPTSTPTSPPTDTPPPPTDTPPPPPTPTPTPTPLPTATPIIDTDTPFPEPIGFPTLTPGSIATIGPNIQPTVPPEGSNANPLPDPILDPLPGFTPKP